MKKTLVTWFILVLSAFSLTGCEFYMITPYKDSTDMASINEAFSSTSSAPWGFAHNRIDFFPTGDLKPFQAVSPGVVESVELWLNDPRWQVNVRIRYDSTFYVEYSFEPFSTVPSDGQKQFDNIFVSAGESVSRGDIIGNLFTAYPGAHVHFGLEKEGAWICPESYFTSEARDSILYLIHKNQPNWNMCY